MNILAQKAHWEHFEHEADIGIRGFGNNISQAFEQAALALSGIITDINTISIVECFSIECQADDHEILFADWLNEIIYQMAIKKMLFSKFNVNITDYRLNAIICGEPTKTKKHHPTVEVKGATYTELHVSKLNHIWLAQCVVDV